MARIKFSLLVSVLEQGVSYPTTPFASTTVPYFSDNFSNTVDFLDGKGKVSFIYSGVPYTTLDNRARAAIPGGPYPLYTDHAFDTAGEQTVMFHGTSHLYNTDYTDHVTETAKLLIVGRTAIGKLSFVDGTAEVQGGNPASLQVELVSPAAYQCGVRVKIDIDKDDQKYFDRPFPFEFGVPFPGNVTTVTIMTKKVEKKVTVVLKGTSTGQAQSVSLTIRP